MINSQGSINNHFNNDQRDRKYDLVERTAKFAEDLIDVVRVLPQDAVNRRMVEQVVASAGSIGANYCEASEAESKKDFIHKVGICKKEVKETNHWLRLLAHANPQAKDSFRKLWKEGQELLFIFSKTIKTSKEKTVDRY